MATYIPNLTDTGLDTPLYQPNFPFIASMLQRKSSMYEQGLSQVRSAFSAIENAPLNTQGNPELRDQYMRQAKDKLKNLSSVDLSMPQNVEAANAVFEPFWQDEELLKDYKKSKEINTQLQKAYSLMESSDPKQREQFWQTGLDAVNLSLRELKMTKRGDGSIDKVQVARYTPYYDVQGYLDKKATEQGIKIETQTTPGGYIKTVINGDKTGAAYEEWAARQLANAPQAMDVFRTQGSVEYKSKAFNIMEQQGVDYTTAKTLVADQYMKDQNQNYTEYFDKYNQQKQRIDTELQAKQKQLEANPSLFDATAKAEMDQLVSQSKQLTQQVDYYKGQKDRFSDTKGEYYTRQKDEIVNGGETFFIENRRDAFIKNYGRIRALNSQVKLELDPIAKMNNDNNIKYAEMRQDQAQHEDNLAAKLSTGISSDGGTGTGGAKKTKTAEEDLNTPLYLGTNTQSNDPIGGYHRMLGTKIKLQDEFLNSGMSLILASGKANKNYTEYLSTVLRTGKFTATQELKDEHKRLQDAGIIPSTLKLGDTPSKAYNLIAEIAEKDRTTGLVSGTDITLSMNRFNAGVQYEKLKAIEKTAQEKIKKDPEISRFFSGDDFISVEKYTAQKLGVKNKAEYIKLETGKTGYQRTIGSSSVDPNTGYIKYKKTAQDAATDYDNTVKATQKEYTKELNKVKGKLSTIMNSYLNEEAAFMGPSIRLRTDGTGTEEKAQSIASQVMNDQNLQSQITTPEGIVPININALTTGTNQADAEEVAGVMKMIKSGAGNVIDAVDITKVGSRGKASVVLRINPKKLTDFLGEDFKVSDATIRSIADKGLEIEVNTPLTSLKEFDTEFTSTGVDRLILGKEGRAEAPQFLKNMGMNYSILSDEYAKIYRINISYPDAKTGKIVTQPSEIPITSSISEIQVDLANRLANIYNYNNSVKQSGANQSTNPFTPQSGSSSNAVLSWDDYKKANNL